jgi:hypothetical protein
LFNFNIVNIITYFSVSSLGIEPNKRVKRSFSYSDLGKLIENYGVSCSKKKQADIKVNKGSSLSENNGKSVVNPQIAFIKNDNYIFKEGKQVLNIGLDGINKIDRDVRKEHNEILIFDKEKIKDDIDKRNKKETNIQKAGGKIYKFNTEVNIQIDEKKDGINPKKVLNSNIEDHQEGNIVDRNLTVINTPPIEITQRNYLTNDKDDIFEIKIQIDEQNNNKYEEKKTLDHVYKYNDVQNTLSAHFDSQKNNVDNFELKDIDEEEIKNSEIDGIMFT